MNGPDLFAAGAERLALASGLPVSQALARVLGTDGPVAGPLFDEPGFDPEHPVD
jgi:hypothetical protein